MTEQGHRWRVGALAASSGLSQRTLRYWDSIGLLRPSARTGGGHREYDTGDLLRLYRILGLRSLGLPLDSIGTYLDGGADTRRIVYDQLAEIDRRLSGARPDDPAVQRLVGRLDRLGARFSGGDPDVGRRIGDAFRDDPAAISGVSDPPADRWRAVADFLDRARSAGAAPATGTGTAPQAGGELP